nr:phage tail tape measure protein [uncultured Mediterranean phage uvMED]BAR25965.1 phage tail tape measure protein [uncultured Mediterranean phage uvMED]BAR26012.1 phage tail tape measure protein [uncultured Mediterranean phage uvMED]BAR26023.1 phage tail tape measure protein [uncultured Mediterranean phage uvMED]BAR26062.1 phage tail tape measure protein [uncultured Mediterranean phage uvMED]
MANYGVDIELKLKGLSDLKQFDKALKSALNTTNSLEKSLKRLGQINPFTAAGARRTPLAIAGGQNLVQTLDVQKSLIKLKQKGLGLDQDSIRENNRILDQKAEEFTKNQRLLEQEQKRLQTARRRRRENAISSAIIGGGFPLLFGQGPGAAVGGALGGGAGGFMGGQMGFALSIAGTAVGSAVDQFVGKITELAGSLKSTESIFSALENAGYKVSDVTKEIAASYEEAGLFADAYQLAINELNSRLGDDGAAKLQAYQDELDRMNGLFEDLSADLVVELLPALTGTTRLILGLKSAFDVLADSPIFKFIVDAARNAAANVPGVGGALQFTLGTFQGIQQLGAAGEEGVRTPDSVTRKQQFSLEQKLADEINRNNIARERLIILDKQLDLAVAGSDILNKDVQLARERLIDEKYNAAVRGSQVTEGEKAVAQRTKELELQKLSNEIARAETAEQKRQLGIQKKISDAAERERKRKENAFKRNEEALLRLQQRGEQQREQQAIKEAQAGGALIDRLSAERELRLAILNGTEDQVIKQQRIEELMAGQEDGMRGIVEQYVELESAEVKAIKQAEQLEALYERIGQSIASGVVDTLSAAVDQTKSLADAAANALRNIANILLRLGTNTLLKSTGLSVFDNLQGFANGGRPPVNRPSIVGERGPELFVPGAQGTIVPNHALGSSNIVVNVDASGTQAQGDQPNAKALGAAIGAAVQAELVKQKRPGGLLS